MFRRTIGVVGLALALVGVQADGASTLQLPPSPDDWCWNCYGNLCLWGDPSGFAGCHDGGRNSNYCSVIPYRLCSTGSRLVVGPSGIVDGEEVLAAASDGTQRGGCGNWIVGIQGSSDRWSVSSDPPTVRI